MLTTLCPEDDAAPDSTLVHKMLGRCQGAVDDEPAFASMTELLQELARRMRSLEQWSGLPPTVALRGAARRAHAGTAAFLYGVAGDHRSARCGTLAASQLGPCPRRGWPTRRDASAGLTGWT